jgi:hypothetical protein
MAIPAGPGNRIAGTPALPGEALRMDPDQRASGQVAEGYHQRRLDAGAARAFPPEPQGLKHSPPGGHPGGDDCRIVPAVWFYHDGCPSLREPPAESHRARRSTLITVDGTIAETRDRRGRRRDFSEPRQGVPQMPLAGRPGTIEPKPMEEQRWPPGSAESVYRVIDVIGTSKNSWRTRQERGGDGDEVARDLASRSAEDDLKTRTERSWPTAPA